MGGITIRFIRRKRTLNIVLITNEDGTSSCCLLFADDNVLRSTDIEQLQRNPDLMQEREYEMWNRWRTLQAEEF